MSAVVAASVLAGISYHSWAYSEFGRIWDFTAVGILAGLAYLAPVIFRNELRQHCCSDDARALRRSFLRWNYAILAVVVVAFLTKTTAGYSRGAFVLFYGAGLIAIIATQLLAARLYRSALASGRLSARRVMFVGTREQMRDWSKGATGDWPGVQIVHRAHLPKMDEGEEALLDALAKHAAKARRLRLDDIIILLPLTQSDRIDRCVEAFTLLPVALHLNAGHILDRFARAEMGRVGEISTLSLSEAPMAPMQAAVKRVGDVAGALIGLVLLAPLFAVVAALIKWDSPGPVFFRQRRLGYNQEEFRIVKFRTMTTTDDGDVIIQAKPGDARITKIGAILRATNLDELPQLINVLRGEMSIVGPRPHAVAHDREFEKRILRYPRRLNVRPGITGWAQVNGLRGETDTDEKMAKRVEHDLYYIDHWSIGLDAYIVLLTLFSAASYRNAR